MQGPYATAVFRIVQESLANVAKHAQATHARVVFEEDEAQVTVSIIDDGRGFLPDSPRKPLSFGHVGLRERASLLGGEARIISNAGEGTTIHVRLPFLSNVARA